MTTSTARQAPPDRLLVITRWLLPLGILVGTLVALTRRAANPLSNFDTYFHLRFGHEFLDGWSLRHPGHVTTFETRDWLPTQWLPEVIMAKAEDFGGLAAVAWLSGLQFVALVLALYVAGRRRGDLLIVAALVPLAILASGSGLSMRPQVISYVLVAVTVASWQRARETAHPPWMLIPLTWVWAMCHGMWPIGIVISVASVVGMTLDRPQAPGRVARLALVPLLSALAAALTPVGPGLFRAVLLVNSRSEFFTEWSPPDFTSIQCLMLLGLLSVTVIPMLRAKKNSWFNIALLAVAAGWSVYSLRTVPVAAAMLVPLGAESLQRVVGARTGPTIIERLIVVSASVLCLATLAFVAPRTAEAPPPQPDWVDQALGGLPNGTVVVNEMVYGGYLIWRYPNLDVTAHGYADVYTSAELTRALALTGVKPGWEETVRATGARLALLAPDNPLAYALVTDKGWRVVHHSEDIELLQAPADWLAPDGS